MWAVRRPTAALGLAMLAVLTAGCGRERLQPSDTVTPARPAGTTRQAFPQAGLFFERPANWAFQEGRPPMVASAISGTATVALWRYLRSEPLPRDDAALDAAEEALVAAEEARDGSFALDEARRVEVDGAPAIEVLGTETVAEGRRRVRSTHVYAKGAEVVVDAYAPAEEFERVDAEVFGPLVESLKIDPPQG
jgi:hypothetical protein